eukprot:gene28534-35387_t
MASFLAAAALLFASLGRVVGTEYISLYVNISDISPDTVIANVRAFDNQIPMTDDEDEEMELGRPEGPTTSSYGVILLHGSKFQAQDWVDLHTLKNLEIQDIPAIAINLPGHGETPAYNFSDNAEFLQRVIEKSRFGVHKRKFILVAPSYSGSFANPHIAKYPRMYAGYMPIAATEIAKWESQMSQPSRAVPTLMLWGELDDAVGPPTCASAQ